LDNGSSFSQDRKPPKFYQAAQEKLKLYADHLGWLHAVPEGESKSRMASEDWPLPDCGDYNYIAHWFVELKLAFDYSQIKDWSQLTGVDVEHWEVQLLSMMSSSYSSGVNRYRAKQYNLHPPYKPANISAIVNKRLNNLFGG